MLELTLPAARRRATRILCLGAHCDDIEIGCGGTLLKLLARGGAWEITWVVFSAEAERAAELRDSVRRFLRRATRTRLITHAFRDSYFPAQYAPIKDAVAALKGLPDPDLIFTHQCEDRHQDHRLVSDLTWNTFRSHLILEYEVPKYDGDLGQPNFFVRLDDPVCLKKIRYILDSFKTQTGKHWLTEDTLQAMLRLRGVESPGAQRYAEAFYCRKMVL